MKTKIIYLLIFFIGVAINNYAQDPYLSQPYASRQFLNPASVGSVNYDQRLNGNIRSQLIDNNKSFQTIFAGWDFRVNRELEQSANYFGFGVNVLSDQIMGGAINTNHVTVNSAYHIFLDDDLYSNIALGLGATVSNTSVDRTKLTFGDQYDAYANLTGNPTAELFINNPTKFSMNTGLLYTKHTNSNFIQLGGSLFFQSTPDLILTTTNNKLNPKTVLYMNVERAFENNYTASIHASFIKRMNNSQLLLGSNLGIPISKNNEFDNKMYLGCYYRVNDAIIPTIKMMFNQYALGLSYDIYDNNITQARIKQNSIELSFSTNIGMTSRRRFSDNRPRRFRTIFE